MEYGTSIGYQGGLWQEFWLCLLNVIIMYSVLSSYSSPPWTQSSNMISRGMRAKNHKCNSNSIWMLKATHIWSVCGRGKKSMLLLPQLFRGETGRGSSEGKLSEVFQRWCYTTSHPTKTLLWKAGCKGNHSSALPAFRVRLTVRNRGTVRRTIRNMAGLDGGTEYSWGVGRLLSREAAQASPAHTDRAAVRKGTAEEKTRDS